MSQNLSSNTSPLISKCRVINYNEQVLSPHRSPSCNKHAYISRDACGLSLGTEFVEVIF